MSRSSVALLQVLRSACQQPRASSLDHSFRALSLLACSEHAAASGQSSPWREARPYASVNAPCPTPAGSLHRDTSQLLLPHSSQGYQQETARTFASTSRKKQRLQRTAAMNRRIQKAHQEDSSLQATGEEADSVMPSETSATRSEVLTPWHGIPRN